MSSENTSRHGRELFTFLWADARHMTANKEENSGQQKIKTKTNSL